MSEYQEFKSSMEILENFIEKNEIKEINNKNFIIIDHNNIDEFMDIMENLISIANSNDSYVNEILEYLNNINEKIIDKNMIAKFIPLFAAINCFAKMTTLPIATKTDIKIDDWVFELHDLDESVPPLDARVGKIINIITNDNGTLTYKVKIPVINEIVEWDDATFVVIPDMENTIKKYQDKYIKTF